ncbi:hypothetical protein [Enterovibrio baiacu]|uniref:hypothetical protein n=1 Tax=Enterovibrio baiacu TaxID=2491023 RepID=UPI003D0F79A6
MKTKILKLSAVAGIFLVSGCVSTTLSKPNGLGAVAIPVSIDMGELKKNYACRSLELDIKKTYRSGSEFDTVISREIYVSGSTTHAIMKDIEPGDYSVSSYRCYANHGWSFGGRNYLNKRASIRFEVLPNKITVAEYVFVGSETLKPSGSTTFSARFYRADEDDIKKTVEAITAEGIPAGWTFAE